MFIRQKAGEEISREISRLAWPIVSEINEVLFGDLFCKRRIGKFIDERSLMKKYPTIHGSNKSDTCAVSNCCIAVEIGISVPVVSYILSKVISVGEYVMRQQEYKKQNKVVLEGIEPVESRGGTSSYGSTSIWPGKYDI